MTMTSGGGSSGLAKKQPGMQGTHSSSCVWESEDRLEAIMMGMRRNDKEARAGNQRKCSSDSSSSSADSGNGKPEEIKEEPDEEEDE